jgi:hypothetical protein
MAGKAEVVTVSRGRGLGRFTGRQLTTIVCVAIVSVVAIPTAAMAAVGTFTSSTAAPAVTGTNSSAATNAVGVVGTNTGNGLNVRYGVKDSANGPAGVGVQGTGTKFGVQSVGPFNATGTATFNGAATVNGAATFKQNATVAAGKKIVCTACVTAADVSVPIPHIAHALISSDATVVRSTAGVSVTTFGTGDFCVQFPAGVVTGHEIATVTPEYGHSPGIQIWAQWDSVNTDSCPSGTEVVHTFDASGSVAEGFTISVS